MRVSKYPLLILRNKNFKEESISYRLMLNSGMIRKSSSGFYIWLPTGLKVLKKLENIIREEMNNIGAIEISMPIMQSYSLWCISDRYKKYGSELFSLKDRNNRLFVLGSTYEEMITNFIANENISYRDLPINLYQIKSKFRDELRPRLGVMRAREFLMKDAYSFHIDELSLRETYNIMCSVYSNILKSMKLKFYIVKAHTGNIGGIISHEFHALSKNGEDNIIISSKSNYIDNTYLDKSYIKNCPKPKEHMRLINLPNVFNINDLIEKHNIPIKKIVKVIIVHGNNTLLALLIRGDHKLSITKAEKLDNVLIPLKLANKDVIKKIIGSNPNFLGPIKMKLTMIADYNVANMSDFISGANYDNKYFFGINWNRDLPMPKIADLCTVVNKDINSNKLDILEEKRSIEVGHIFQLGTKYSKIFKANVQIKNNENRILNMGCYGLGITRLLTAIIEQNHDKLGILWPEKIAPFYLAIIPINILKSFKVREVSEYLYKKLNSYNLDILIYDKEDSPGVMFNNIDLIGIPHIIIISENNINKRVVEYKKRSNNEKYIIPINQVVDFILKIQ